MSPKKSAIDQVELKENAIQDVSATKGIKPKKIKKQTKSKDVMKIIFNYNDTVVEL